MRREIPRFTLVFVLGLVGMVATALILLAVNHYCTQGFPKVAYDVVDMNGVSIGHAFESQAYDAVNLGKLQSIYSGRLPSRNAPIWTERNIPDDFTAVSTVGYGWPCRFIARSDFYDHRTARSRRDSLRLIPSGLLIDLVLFSVTTYFGMYTIAHIQRVRRKHAGKCTYCGYMLHGLTVDRCPECGKPFGSR